MKYKSIRNGVNTAQEKAFEWHADIDELKLIVFSDLHRGKRDGADDFLPCEKTYQNALQYYLSRGYNLMLLGDVDELWENQPQEVLKSYNNVLLLEREFYLRNRLFRIWGNHDDLWSIDESFKFHFKKMFPEFKVFESIALTVNKHEESIGNILFLHGHQGTLMSSRFAGFSKFFVQIFWRPIQRLFKIKLNTAAKDQGLRYKTDKAMDFWASIRSRQLIVCGHTHQYIFGSTIFDDGDDKPCYFNTGCCSYGNGNISGLEISNGKIRIVEWEPQSAEPYYVHKESLETIFNRCQ